MFTVYVYDQKVVKRYKTPLDDPFNEGYIVGKYEVYDDAGNCILHSYDRRVKGTSVHDPNFLPLNLLKAKLNLPNLVRGAPSQGRTKKNFTYYSVDIREV